jgi:cyanophycin synthetase
MELVDVRRLTGPSTLARCPLVIVELGLTEAEAASVCAVYLGELARMRAALGMTADVALIERPHKAGMVLAYAAPIDIMLACTEMSEWAALSACELLASRAALPLEPKRAEVEAMLARERDPKLLAVQAEAAKRKLPFLWDDELVSVGMGVCSASFPRAAVPDVGDVPWERLGRIPVALVTGTNGKTTSSRLLGRVAREAGKHVGVTSSDAISVGSQVMEEGDWTGPAAARLVLRNPEVDFAVLETARGGILRRGLAVEACDVALVTNISDDHVGGYGIDDLTAMTRVKAVTVEAARASGGAVVVNANDPRLVSLAREGDLGRVTFFADLERAGAAAHEVIAQHRAAGGTAVFTADGAIVRARGPEERVLTDVSSVPITFQGAARFNVENALGVVAAATAIGLADDAIVRALEGFVPDENPRRTSLLERGGVRVMLDFGHNAEGVRAAMQLVTSLRGGEGGKQGQLTVITGAAGDRSDRDIEEVARVLLGARPDHVMVRELEHYLRGRAPGEIPEIFRRAFVAHGLAPEAFTVAASEVDALRTALASARPGDFIVLLIHVDHAEVQAFLAGP